MGAGRKGGVFLLPINRYAALSIGQKERKEREEGQEAGQGKEEIFGKWKKWEGHLD